MREVAPGHTVGECEQCGASVERFRGDPGPLRCACGAIFSIFGQRLRDDLLSRPNPSEWDEDIDDLAGDELSWLALERDA